MRNRLLAALTVPLALFAAVPAAGQVPVEPHDVSGRYGTTLLSVQAAGGPDHAREFMLGRGRMWAGGWHGWWMRRVELLAGLRTGDGSTALLAGPQATLAAALPGQFMMVGELRAEPYVLAGGGVTGILQLQDDAPDGVAPGVHGGAGLRLLAEDPWSVSLDYVELIAERRFGELGDAWQVYFRLGRAVGLGPRTAPPPRGAPPASPPR